MNWKNSLVAVFCPTTDGEKAGFYGTAFPIANPDLIMTARHNVRPKNVDKSRDLKLRWWNSNLGWEQVSHGEDGVCWESEELDLALIKFPRPDALTDYCQLSFVPPRELDNWASEGFPKGSRLEDKIEPASFGGKTLTKADKENFFEAICETGTAPSSIDGWGGASGMPIVAYGRAIGVAIEVWKGFDTKKIKVAPLWKLTSDADFLRLAGFERDNTRFKRKTTRIIGQFLENKEAKEAASEDSPVLENLTTKYSNASEIVDALMELEPSKVFEAVVRAKRSIADVRAALSDDQIGTPCPYRRGLEQLDRLARHIAPLLLVLSGTRSTLIGNALLQDVPVSTSTMAEIVAAAFDERPADFFPRAAETDYEPRGKSQVRMGLRFEGESTFIDLLGNELEKSQPQKQQIIQSGTVARCAENLLANELGEERPLNFEAMNTRIEIKAGAGEPRPFLAIELPKAKSQRDLVLADLREVGTKLPALPIFLLTTRSDNVEDKRIRAAEIKELGAFPNIIPIAEDVDD